MKANKNFSSTFGLLMLASLMLAQATVYASGSAKEESNGKAKQADSAALARKMSPQMQTKTANETQLIPKKTERGKDELKKGLESPKIVAAAKKTDKLLTKRASGMDKEETDKVMDLVPAEGKKKKYMIVKKKPKHKKIKMEVYEPKMKYKKITMKIPVKKMKKKKVKGYMVKKEHHHHY